MMPSQTFTNFVTRCPGWTLPTGSRNNFTLNRIGTPPLPDGPVEDRRHATSVRSIALIVASALFMEQLDTTMLATALPSIAHSFNANPIHMNVALTSYLLSLAVFIPASGQM